MIQNLMSEFTLLKICMYSLFIDITSEKSSFMMMTMHIYQGNKILYFLFTADSMNNLNIKEMAIYFDSNVCTLHLQIFRRESKVSIFRRSSNIYNSIALKSQNKSLNHILNILLLISSIIF